MSNNIFVSPFVIPVAGMALALGIILIGSISEFAPAWAKAGSGLSTDIGIDPLPPLRLPRRSQGLRLWPLDVRILNN